MNAVQKCGPEDSWAFDILIDKSEGRIHTYALDIAVELCNTCPLRDTCLPQHREEQWAQAIARGIKAPRRDCQHCGVTFNIHNNRGRSRRFCSDNCGTSYRRQQKKAA